MVRPAGANGTDTMCAIRKAAIARMYRYRYEEDLDHIGGGHEILRGIFGIETGLNRHTVGLSD